MSGEHTPNAQVQYNDVVDLYNTIALMLRRISEYTVEFQMIKDAMIEQIDALPITHPQKLKIKTQSPRFVGITRLLAQSTAQILIVEGWEENFRNKWKQNKKESLVQRDVWLDKKGRELEKIQRKFRDDMKKWLKEAGIRVAEDEEEGTDTESVEVVGEKETTGEVSTEGEAVAFETDGQIDEAR